MACGGVDFSNVAPVTEEEVVVHKRPVLKEEVRIRKDVVEETKVVEEDVRREEVEYETERRGGASRGGVFSEIRPLWYAQRIQRNMWQVDQLVATEDV